MPLVSDRPAVIELATKLHRDVARYTKKQAALAAIQSFYDLALQDGIWGGSIAAVCMGYAECSTDENVLERIVKSVAQELPNRRP